MKWRFTISRKIAFGFGLFIVVVIVLFLITTNTLRKGFHTNQQITQIYTPSVRAIEDIQSTLLRSFQLMDHWVHVQSRDDDFQKEELREEISVIIPRQRALIDSLSMHWNHDDRVAKMRLFDNIDRLILGYNQVMATLPDFKSYSDPESRFSAEETLLPGSRINRTLAAVQSDLHLISSHQEELLNKATDDVNKAYAKVRIFSLWIMVGTVIGGMIIALIVIRTIVVPIHLLKKTLLYLGKGIYPRATMSVTNDEIGDMSFAVNRLVDGLKKTKEFSTQVGAGNFDASYYPLSDDDELGFALLKMRDDLAKTERDLERKVFERTNEVVRQKEQLEKQKEQVMVLYKDLTDSINYARRIQQTILPPKDLIKVMFPDSFVFYLPKDIVSGDFYWFKTSGKKKMFAAVDCTGHGVPGAFMSLVGHNVLNQVSKVFSRPDQVLNNLNRIALEVLSAGTNDQIRDGMDLAFCTLDSETLELEYAGAYNSIFVIRDGVIEERKGDKYSIGSFDYGDKKYTNHNLQLLPGDCVYIFSDGYADQFGGPKNKKFLRKRFRKLLEDNSERPMREQVISIKSAYMDWKGNNDQVDDILVIGIRV